MCLILPPSFVLKCDFLKKNVFEREKGKRDIVRVPVCTQWGGLEIKLLP